MKASFYPVLNSVALVLQRYKSTIVDVYGHTDSTGTRPSNFALGLRRANTVRSLLRDIGLDAGSVDVVSHGETVLLVPSVDGIFEARNRRVEITVR